MGKGDNRRPSSIPKEEYDENFESVFGKKKLNIWEDKDADLGTGEGDSSGSGPDHNVSGESTGRPDPATEESLEEATCCAESRTICPDDHVYNCPKCGRRITAYETGGGEGFYWAECGRTPLCPTKWILYSDDGDKQGLKTWDEIKSEGTVRTSEEEMES